MSLLKTITDEMYMSMKSGDKEKVEEPPKRKAGIKVANVAELVQKLKNT